MSSPSKEVLAGRVIESIQACEYKPVSIIPGGFLFDAEKIGGKDALALADIFTEITTPAWTINTSLGQIQKPFLHTADSNSPSQEVLGFGLVGGEWWLAGVKLDLSKKLKRVRLSVTNREAKDRTALTITVTKNRQSVTRNLEAQVIPRGWDHGKLQKNFNHYLKSVIENFRNKVSVTT